MGVNKEASGNAPREGEHTRYPTDDTNLNDRVNIGASSEGEFLRLFSMLATTEKTSASFRSKEHDDGSNAEDDIPLAKMIPKRLRSRPRKSFGKPMVISADEPN